MKPLKIISGILALGFWGRSFYAWTYFNAHEPHAPDNISGRVLPLSTHGSVVYLTPGEQNLLYGLIGAGAAFFLLAASFYYSQRKQAR